MKVFILDVDGVLTDGCFYYNRSGKVYKSFSADDADGLSLLSQYINICFVTGDKRGLDISKKRIEDMGFEVNLVSTVKRVEWIKEKYLGSDVIYMGDGIFDAIVMSEMGYGIATIDSDSLTQLTADYVTTRKGGDRAVAEACKHILKEFFGVDIGSIKGLKEALSFGMNVAGDWAA